MNSWAQTIRAVAFDMDGLLVNTEDLYTEVGETLLQRRGRRFTPKLKKAMMGLPGPQAFAVMIAHEQLGDTAETLALETDEIFVELLPRKLQKLPGLDELLVWLDEQQLPRCVATSSTPAFAREVLQQVDLWQRFDFVLTAEDVVHGKPAPDIYWEAARRMQVSPGELLVLEDSQHGSQAGVRAGACTIAVPGKHSQDHDFRHVFYCAQSLADAGIRRVLGNRT